VNGNDRPSARDARGRPLPAAISVLTFHCDNLNKKHHDHGRNPWPFQGQNMPKLKTHTGAKKRFKKTGTGKIMRHKAYARHLLSSKTTSRKRTWARASSPTKPTRPSCAECSRTERISIRRARRRFCTCPSRRQKAESNRKPLGVKFSRRRNVPRVKRSTQSPGFPKKNAGPGQRLFPNQEQAVPLRAGGSRKGAALRLCRPQTQEA